MTADRVLLRTHEVAELAGLSFRQLDHWARNAVARPTLGGNEGSGSQRRWDMAEAAVVATLVRFCECGHGSDGTGNARGSLRILANLAGELRKLDAGQVVVITGGGRSHRDMHVITPEGWTIQELATMYGAEGTVTVVWPITTVDLEARRG